MVLHVLSSGRTIQKYKIPILLYIAFIHLLCIILYRNESNPSHRSGNTNPPVPKHCSSAFPPEWSCRQYQRCLTHQIPYISPPLETAYELLYTNKSFIRFGDSEVMIIRGIDEYFQKATPELQEGLTIAFTDPDPNLMIGLYDTFSGFPAWTIGHISHWFDTQDGYRQWVLSHANFSRHYFAAMVTSTYVHTYGTHCALLNELYGTFRLIWTNRDVVLLRGNNNQNYKHDIFDTARSKTVLYAPKTQAWSVYGEMKAMLFKESPDKLYILSAGPMARVLAYDLAKAGRRALDLGHIAKDYDYFKENVKPNASFFVDQDPMKP